MELTKHITETLFGLFTKNRTRNKLHLVLDLDHTLVHSILVSDLSPKEQYLIEEVDSRADLWRFDQGHGHEFLIKLRPFTREFLHEANKLFSLSVYTMGNSERAQQVLRVIDPSIAYFGDRVITSDQSPHSKTLDLVPADKRRVLIVDDTREVWPHHRRNLLLLTRYMYFRQEEWSRSYADYKGDESRTNGSLADVLKFLRKVHKRYQDKIGPKDVRLMIRDRRRRF